MISRPVREVVKGTNIILGRRHRRKGVSEVQIQFAPPASLRFPPLSCKLPKMIAMMRPLPAVLAQPRLFISHNEQDCKRGKNQETSMILATCSAVDVHKAQAADERRIANSLEQCCNVPESHVKEFLCQLSMEPQSRHSSAK
jgi:hypothetical protein